MKAQALKPAIAENDSVDTVDHVRPTMKSSALDWQSEGQHWRQALVKLPPNVLTDDLREPEFWRLVQSVKRTELRRLDRVTAIAADGSWIARDLLVIEADEYGAKLAIRSSDIVHLPKREDAA